MVALERDIEAQARDNLAPSLPGLKQRIANIIRPLYVSIREYQEAENEEDTDGKWQSVKEATNDAINRL